ncbi:hypothetical protein [Deminuibacter soli]|uniref:Cell division protein ZapB n=1 Tax=Deminuibacter soli TaxID=2291815 RepID=A0A3E1NPH6_9BACT|nr:hypothetical protein [Deminuibacter soli]RFM29836.1 hypothetical protein DXN05_02335 [Deminuibacter soli]
MADLETQLKAVHDKLQQLLRQYQVLQKENLQLKTDLQQAKQVVKTREDKVQQLQEQLDIVQISTGNLNGTEKKALEKRIDGYLKEIEKCLSLLNA